MKFNIGLELTVEGASADGDNPRRDVRHRLGRGSTVTGRANDGDTFPHGVECANCNAVIEIVPRVATERHGDDVDAVVDGSVYGFNNVGVVTPALLFARPTYFVRRHPSTRRATFRSAIPGAEYARSGDKATAKGGEGVGSMALVVSGSIHVVAETITIIT